MDRVEVTLVGRHSVVARGRVLRHKHDFVDLFFVHQQLGLPLLGIKLEARMEDDWPVAVLGNGLLLEPSKVSIPMKFDLVRVGLAGSPPLLPLPFVSVFICSGHRLVTAFRLECTTYNQGVSQDR